MLSNYPKELHPIELVNKYGLTYLQLAEELGVTEATVRKWVIRPGLVSRREPSKTAYILAARIDKELSGKINYSQMI